MLHTVFVDASALICPIINEGGEDGKNILSRYVNRLLEIDDMTDSSVFKVMAARSASEILFEAELYPVHTELKNSLSITGLDEELQSSDVVRVLDKLLKTLPNLEEEILLCEFLHGAVHADAPSVLLSNECVKEKVVSQYVALGIGREVKYCLPKMTWVLGEAYGPLKNVKVKARVVDIEWASEDELLEAPFDVNAEFPFCIDFNDIRNAVDLCSIRRTPCDDWIDEVISLALIQRQSKDLIENCLDWSIGRDFCRTIANLHIHNNEVVFAAFIDACIDTICNSRMAKTHRLRVGESGNSDPKKSGNSFAWRRDIDVEFHLHYWLNGNKCEFASVVVHNVFSIPDCSLS